jgi:AraC-like DNA-binding protein
MSTGNQLGVTRFNYSGLATSPAFDELRTFADVSLLRPTLVPTARSTASSGLRLGGSTSALSLSRPEGFAAVQPGHGGEPRYLHIATAGPGLKWNDERLWLASEATASEVEYTKPYPIVSVIVPLAAAMFDYRALDLRSGVALECPPIAMHALNSVGHLLTGDIGEWMSRTPEAIDRYLAGLANLVASLLIDQGGDVEQHDRRWLHGRAVALIEAQFHDPRLAPASIATKLAISLRSLHRAFEGQIGVAEALRQRRVAQAAELLAGEEYRDLSIDEISRRCGFGSLSTFERSFADVHHCSPRSFRQAGVAGGPNERQDAQGAS